jgi:multidrug efflux system membrane fusion protein
VSETPVEPPKKSSTAKWVTIGILVLVVLAVAWAIQRRRAVAAAQAAQARMAAPPVPVVVSTVKEQDVPVYLDGLGTVQAFNTVTVHVRVDGQLNKVAFTEGQDVKAGDVLAQIDPAPFQAALEQAKGKKGQDQALLDNANLDMKREIDLYAAKVDSQQVYDTQKALVAQDEAAVKADQAAIDSAQVNLNYCTVTSPIDGRTGIRQVDQGNIVHAADPNGLVVLTQLKPISVLYTLPEQNLSDIHKQERASGSKEMKVLAVDRDNTTNINVLDEGTLAVIDNQIDPTTGTIRLKATFPNEHLQLWPGQFVNVRQLLTTRSNSLTVPAAAIQRGPSGAYVFTVSTNKPAGKGAGASGKKPAGDGSASDAESKPAAAQAMKSDDHGTNAAEPIFYAKIQPVTVAAQMEAGQALVESGVAVGDRVVTDGQYKLQDSSPVKISNGATNGVNKVAGSGKKPRSSDTNAAPKDSTQ